MLCRGGKPKSEYRRTNQSGLQHDSLLLSTFDGILASDQVVGKYPDFGPRVHGAAKLSSLGPKLSSHYLELFGRTLLHTHFTALQYLGHRLLVFPDSCHKRTSAISERFHLLRCSESTAV